MVYMGPAKKVPWYFEQLGIRIPEGTNPADFCLDVLSGVAKPHFNSYNRHHLEDLGRYSAVQFLTRVWADEDPFAPVHALLAENSKLDIQGQEENLVAPRTPVRHAHFFRGGADVVPFLPPWLAITSRDRTWVRCHAGLFAAMGKRRRRGKGRPDREAACGLRSAGTGGDI